MPTVTRSDLGAWLLKRAPAGWDGVPGGRLVDDWCVVRGYRSRLIAAGDPVLVWVSGDGRRVPRGLWGLGQVVRAPEVDDLPPGRQPAVRVDVPLFAEPVPAADLLAAGVDDLEVQRLPVGANPSFVSVGQLARLRPLLP
ncbi:EVE domain-containing protein [Angustibacter aerolatus]